MFCLAVPPQDVNMVRANVDGRLHIVPQSHQIQENVRDFMWAVLMPLQLIRVNALRLDPANTSIVLDCCVCPLTQANAIIVGSAQQNCTDGVVVQVHALDTLSEAVGWCNLITECIGDAGVR